MKNCTPPDDRTSRRILPLVCATALAVALTLPLAQRAHAGDVTPPDVPAEIAVPPGNEAFLVGHALGTQNYVCLASSSGFSWTLFTPEATLFNDGDKQIITHFFSPNPCEPNTNPKVVVADGTIRASWQSSRDSSTFWGFVENGHSYTKPDFVEPGAVAWLRLTRVGVRRGPTGGEALTETTYVQRVNTHGGLAPATGCSVSTDVGKLAFVPYTADYFFYDGPDSDSNACQ